MTETGFIKPKRKQNYDPEYEAKTLVSKELQHKRTKISAVVQKWINDTNHKGTKKWVRAYFKEMDEIRLLRLQVWEIWYRVPVDEILDLIVPVLRGQKHQSIINKYLAEERLGISVATLISPRAETILQQELKKKYPSHDNISIWREQAKTETIQREQAKESDGIKTKKKGYKFADFDSSEEFVKQYNADIQKMKALDLEGKWRSRKKYRDNPWIS